MHESSQWPSLMLAAPSACSSREQRTVGLHTMHLEAFRAGPPLTQHRTQHRSIAHTASPVQVRSIGKRDYNSLFKLGDEMIQFQGLHTLLAAAVADMVPGNVGVLLSEDVKRQVRVPPSCLLSHGCHDRAPVRPLRPCGQRSCMILKKIFATAGTLEHSRRRGQ